jgi:hypothetical protein
MTDPYYRQPVLEGCMELTGAQLVVRAFSRCGVGLF